MTQPSNRRFVMHNQLDATVAQIDDALDLKANTADLGEAAYLDKNQFDNIGNLDYAQFDTTFAGGSTAPGMLAWDQDNETLEFMLDDHVTLQVGQEHVMRVKNNSGSVAIPERTVVMFAGATGDTIKVAPAVSDGSVNVNYLAGITTEEIPADGFGFITQLGFINQVNTNGWPVGTILYVDPATPGGLTATEPDLPAWTMPVAAVTKQNVSAGRMLVRAIPGGSGAGGSSVVISDTVPAGGNKGDLWLDSTDGTLYIYFEDVDGSQWIQVQANSALEGSILSRLSQLEATNAQQLASATIKVASATERDTKFPSPVQGNSVFRNDLGYVQTYYALYNVSTNPGGRTPAGWYDVPGASKIAYGEGGTTGHQTSTVVADWSGPVTASVQKNATATKLLLTAVVHFSPQYSPTDNNTIYIQINGTDYELLQFNTGVQYALQQRHGAALVTGIPSGTYTAKLRYKAVGAQSLYSVSWAKSFITITEVA